jgi:hypothetical protein
MASIGPRREWLKGQHRTGDHPVTEAKGWGVPRGVCPSDRGTEVRYPPSNRIPTNTSTPPWRCRR